MTNVSQAVSQQPPAAQMVPTADFFDIDLRKSLQFLKRRKRIILGTTLVCLVSVLAVLLVITPRYNAQAVVQLDVRSKNVVDIESVVSGLSADESVVQSEVDILNSRHLIGKVVDTLFLTDDPEFNPSISGQKWIRAVLDLFGDDQPDAQEQYRMRSETITQVQKRLHIHRKPRSYTIYVNFSSESPQKAASIANTIANEYILNQLNIKFDATERANKWLSNRLNELKIKVRESEFAVQAFAEKNDLIEAAGMTINDQQLSELNSQLILARTERAQAEARLRNSKNASSTSEVLNSDLIQNLRAQETEVLRKKSDLSTRYGKRHPKIINVNNELRDLRNKISQEIKKIVQGLKNSVEVARSREKSLEASLNKLKGKSNVSTKARIQLAELQRERDANQTLYNAFLTRFKETSENTGFEQADARIVSPAEAPIEPSYPKKKLGLLLAGIFGLFLGTFVAFIIERFDNVVHSANELDDTTGVNHIGLIPELERGTDFIQYVVDNLGSVFAESLRTIVAAIHFSNPDKKPKTVMVTSSVPDEGKTSFSIALATVVAKSGKKVLLIDCDLKRPSLGRFFGTKKKIPGLGDFLTQDLPVKNIVFREKQSGVDFIVTSAHTPNSQELLSSQKMAAFLKDMSKRYDLIILDSPPVMATSDSLILSDQVDTSVFVTRWAKTPKPVIKTAIAKLKAKQVAMAGTILSRVDMQKHSEYGDESYGYYYGKYKDYYAS